MSYVTKRAHQPVTTSEAILNMELTNQKVRKVNMYIITCNDMKQEKSFIFSCYKVDEYSANQGEHEFLIIQLVYSLVLPNTFVTN